LAKPASTGVRFTPRRLPAKDAAAYVEQSITGAPNRFEARVTLHAAAEEIRSRVPAYWGAIEPIDAHTCEYRTGDDDLRWLALRIAMLGVDFEVHEPHELGRASAGAGSSAQARRSLSRPVHRLLAGMRGGLHVHAACLLPAGLVVLRR
jgi:hypothetical protein